MQVIRIALKDLRQTLRDSRSNALMILLPIVLMTVLGAALSRVFDNTITLESRVLYNVQGTGPLAASFNSFITGTASLGVSYTDARDVADGRTAVQDTAYSCLIDVSDSGITVYKNDRFAFEADFVESLVHAFLRRYDTIAAIASVDPAAAARALAAAVPALVETVSVEGTRQPRAIDYYAVTMLTFTVMMASVLGMSGMRREMRLRTARRIITAPVRKGELLAGKLTGGLLVTVAQVCAVILFSRYVIGAYWGADVTTVVGVVLSQAVMAVALGAAVAFLIPNEGAAAAVLNCLFPVLVFFGGGYSPLNGIGPVMKRITELDPITWVNRSVFEVIYSGAYGSVATAVLFCLGAAAVFVALAALLSRKEDL